MKPTEIQQQLVAEGAATIEQLQKFQQKQDVFKRFNIHPKTSATPIKKKKPRKTQIVGVNFIDIDRLCRKFNKKAV